MVEKHLEPIFHVWQIPIRYTEIKEKQLINVALFYFIFCWCIHYTDSMQI